MEKENSIHSRLIESDYAVLILVINRKILLPSKCVDNTRSSTTST